MSLHVTQALAQLDNINQVKLVSHVCNYAVLVQITLAVMFAWQAVLQALIVLPVNQITIHSIMHVFLVLKNVLLVATMALLQFALHAVKILFCYHLAPQLLACRINLIIMEPAKAA